LLTTKFPTHVPLTSRVEPAGAELILAWRLCVAQFTTVAAWASSAPIDAAARVAAAVRAARARDPQVAMAGTIKPGTRPLRKWSFVGSRGSLNGGSMFALSR
jgi:hypothetical protein